MGVDMHARLAADLLGLSMQRVTGKRQPVVLSNDVRARIFRAAMPSPTQNAHAWNFKDTLPRPALASLPNPSPGRVQGLSPDAPDYDYFRAHDYADLSGGF